MSQHNTMIKLNNLVIHYNSENLSQLDEIPFVIIVLASLYEIEGFNIAQLSRNSFDVRICILLYIHVLVINCCTKFLFSLWNCT